MKQRHPAECGECQASVIWAFTPMGKRMPLDPEPNAEGNTAAYRDGTGRWRARVLRTGEQPAGYERLYMPHFATCPVRKKAPV